MRANAISLASSYLMEGGLPLAIDGKVFPFYVHEDGPRVQQIEPGAPFHILWVPILVESPLPGYVTEKPGEPA